MQLSAMNSRTAVRSSSGRAPKNSRSIFTKASAAPRPLSGSILSAAKPSGHREQHVCASSTRPAVAMFGMFGGGNEPEDDFDEAVTVAKVQVGVFGDIAMWQKKLDAVSDKYDTDDEEGLHSIFKDTLTLMLRNMEYCNYATSAGKVFDNLDDAERKFNQVTLEERMKFKEETKVNVDGKRKERTMVEPMGVGDGLDNWMCITMVVVVDGTLKLQKMNSPTDLKQVLMTLGGVGVDDLIAFELLWTPQAAGDYYTKQELLMDFPTMATLA